jgi:hypothetical protein
MEIAKRENQTWAGENGVEVAGGFRLGGDGEVGGDVNLHCLEALD